MIGWLVAGAAAAPFVAAMYVASRGVWCNVRQLRHALQVPPLEGLDLTGATVAPVEAPRRWPAVEGVADAAAAAAYASLAESRAANWAVAGDAVVIGAGAILGALLTPPYPTGWIASGSLGAAFGTGVVGLLLRAEATRMWKPLAARYRARYTVLTAPSAPVAPPAPPSLRERLLGRLSRTRGTR